MTQVMAKFWTSSKPFRDWLDHRTGYRLSIHKALYEHIPGGSRWIYVSGSMLVCAFMTQVVTGLFLWMYYSPGSQNAWESVYFLQNEVQGGWLLRGVHHFMAQAMVVLLPCHLAQVVLCRAYVAPREINYWLGLVLMLLVMGLGLTGYLLPWDQKGYWATKVATELMSLPPGGAYMQKLVVGGQDYGHMTLTRFFALHAGLLPALLLGVLGLHLAMFRRHGITAESSTRQPDEHFWPKQVFKDAVACAAMFVVVIGITIWKHGAELGPPAEPTESYGAARPEWYFLFLFQLLKFFSAEYEFVGAIVVPGLVMGFLFAMPLIARIRYLHWINVLSIVALIGGAAYLTYAAIDDDNYHTRHTQPPADPKRLVSHQEKTEAAINFHEAREQAEREYQRIKQLVEYYGIGREGASVSLVRNDPEIQGPRLFRRKCASCHAYLDADGKGIRGPERPVEISKSDSKPPPHGAPNLYGFATRDWFLRFLDSKRIQTDEVFGATKHREGEMANFVTGELIDLSPEQQQQREQIVTALVAEAGLPASSTDVQAAAQESLEKAREAVSTAIKDQACTDCHKFRETGELGTAPDLTGYGTGDWLRAFLADPAHERFYGPKGNDRMPSFALNAEKPQLNQLSNQELDMLVRWLRGDDRQLGVATK
jgi:ubiquinol-cytochrome c reductase cytochrome b subunit